MLSLVASTNSQKDDMTIRPFAYGRQFRGIATAVGAFTITDLDGNAVTVGTNERVVLYNITGNIVGTVTVGYDTTAVTGAGDLTWGVALPVGKPPAVVALTTTTAVYCHGEILPHH